MSNKEEAMKYNSMICYRKCTRDDEGKITGNTNFLASENLAGIIYEWMRIDDGFSDCRPLLFQEVRPAGDGLTYTEDGIKKFMPDMQNVVVVICPDFFSEIFTLYEQCGNLEKTLAELNKETKISFLEIKHALEAAKKGCFLFPVFVEYQNRKPNEELSDTIGAESLTKLDILKAYFGEDIQLLFTQTNIPCFDYDSISYGMKHWKGWYKAKAKPDEIQALMTAVESREEVTELKEDLLFSIKQKHDYEELTVEELKEELAACAETISNKSRTLHVDESIIYDPLKACLQKERNEERDPSLAKCQVDKFEEYQKNFALPSNTLSYWNIDLRSEYDVDEIDTFAACYGTLVINHRLKSDQPYLEDTPDPEYADHVAEGLNMLVALRNPYTKTWPAKLFFDGMTKGLEGTLNSTTVALSCLLSCGFLQPSERAAQALSALNTRYNFIWESIDKVLNASFGIKTNNRSALAWGYTFSAKNTRATLPTVFVFETLLKAKLQTENLLRIFPSDDSFYEELSQRNVKLKTTLCSIIHRFAHIQRASGAFRRLEKRGEDSLTHTAYVVRALVAFSKQSNQNGNQDFDEEMLTITENIIVKAAKYIKERVVSIQKENMLRLKDHETSDDFDGDKYEHCVELILMDTLIKLSEYLPATPQNREEYAIISNRCFDLAEWLLKRYHEQKDNVIQDDDNFIYIRSGNRGYVYPIYGVYYYRMVLLNYLLHLQNNPKNVNTENNTESDEKHQ